MSWLSFLSFFSGLSALITKLFDYFERMKIKNEGKKEAVDEINAQQIEIERKQTEVIMTEKTRDEVISDLEKGKF